MQLPAKPLSNRFETAAHLTINRYGHCYNCAEAVGDRGILLKTFLALHLLAMRLYGETFDRITAVFSF